MVTATTAPQAPFPSTLPAKPGKNKLVLEGTIRTSFAMQGSVHWSLDAGTFDSRVVNDFLRAHKNRPVKITVEGL